MSSPISVKIPVPAWMKKYLIFQSKNGSEPIVFHNKHAYNRLLINLVSNRPDIKILPNPKEEDINNETVKIKLPFNSIKDVYFYNKLNYRNQIEFRNQIKLDFLYQYMIEIRKKTILGIERKKATEEFLEMININEDELKYESLYRKFSRYINKKKSIV